MMYPMLTIEENEKSKFCGKISGIHDTEKFEMR